MKIKRIENGAIVTYNKYEYGENEIPVEKAYTWEETPDHLIKMLYEILEGIGIYGDKYEEKIISIKYIHGSKYVCKDKNCEICKEGGAF